MRTRGRPDLSACASGVSPRLPESGCSVWVPADAAPGVLTTPGLSLPSAPQKVRVLFGPSASRGSFHTARPSPPHGMPPDPRVCHTSNCPLPASASATAGTRGWTAAVGDTRSLRFALPACQAGVGRLLQAQTEAAGFRKPKLSAEGPVPRSSACSCRRQGLKGVGPLWGRVVPLEATWLLCLNSS